MLEFVIEKKLSNGMKIIVLPYEESEITAIQVWYAVGSSCESESNYGISHIVEHMMFRGSENFDSEEHTKKINSVGGNANAFTAEDVTAFINTVPKEHTEMVLELEADRMQKITVDEKLFKTEQSVIIEEFHNYINNPMTKSFIEFRSLVLKNSIYEKSALGTLDCIKSITADDVRKYHKTYYTPDNAVLVIVGGIADSEKLFRSIESYFGSIEKKGQKSPASSGETDESGDRINFIKEKIDFDVPMLIAGEVLPNLSRKEALALDVVMNILATGETSVLKKSMVDQANIAVMAGGAQHFLKFNSMILFFVLFTPNIPVRKIVKSLQKEIQKGINNSITEENVSKIINMYLTDRYFNFYSVETVCQKLGYAELVEGSYSAYSEKMKLLEEISSDFAKEVAAKYLLSRNLNFLYLAPKRIHPLLYIMGIVNKITAIFRRGSK